MSAPRQAKNAFAILGKKRQASEPRSSQKRPSAGPSAGPQSRLAACPICGASVHHLLLEDHVDSCLGSAEGRGGPKRIKRGSVESVETAPTQVVQSGGASVSAGLRVDAEEHEGTPCGGASTSGGAFQVLLSSERARCTRQYFYLERTGQGCWTWHWGKMSPNADRPPDLPPPAWSSVMSLRSVSMVPVHVPGSVLPKGAKHSLVLLTNIPPQAGGAWDEETLGAAHPRGEPRYTGWPGLLKSALQKNVRLCRADAAARVALHLMAMAPEEALRRIPVICVEDAILHPAMALLVWLAAACGKGHRLGFAHAATVAEIVHQVASVPLRDVLGASEDDGAPMDDEDPTDSNVAAGSQRRGEPGPTTASTTMAEVMASHEDPMARAAVASVLLRAVLGGMRGDVELLHQCAAAWHARLQGRGDQARPPVAQPPPPGCICVASELVDGGPGSDELAGDKAACEVWMGFLAKLHAQQAGRMRDPRSGEWVQLDVARLGPVQPEDIPVAAVDFHCSDIVESLLADEGLAGDAVREAARAAVEAAPERLKSPEEAIRRAMWRFSSSTNARMPMWEPPSPAGDDVALQQALEVLWSVVGPHATTWAESLIASKFESS